MDLTKLNTALNDWYNYQGFGLATNHEEQQVARLEQKRLAELVEVELAKLR